MHAVGLGPFKLEQNKLFVFLDADAPLFIPEYKTIEIFGNKFAMSNTSFRQNPLSLFRPATRNTRFLNRSTTRTSFTQNNWPNAVSWVTHRTNIC